ncbi:MAG: RidA family protein [Gordonia sp. (in: high G+C Gram-positive bacteria)]
MARVRLNGSAALPDNGFAYSATVTAGPLIFTAGISPFAADGAIAEPGDVVGQTRRCLRNLSAVLAEQGAGLADIAKLTVYVAQHLQVDLSVAWDAVVAEFDAVPPAMIVGVTVLPYDDQLVEIDAVAAPPQD